jgi:UDP-glucose 4-epimerase
VRVLVTGAAGYVGGMVADTVAAAGHHVTALVRSPGSRPTFACPVEVVVADLLNPAQLAAVGVGRGFDAVCHLAGLTRVRESRLEPLRYFAANVTGTVNLLAELEHGTELTGVVPVVVFGSTCAVYGEPDSTVQPIPESHSPQPRHPYGASKAAAEQVLAYQAATGRIGAVVLRSFNVAGAAGGHADTDRTRIVPAALAVAAGDVDSFGVNGDGGTIREYVHLEDMAQAYLAALNAVGPGRYTVYNVGGGTGVSINEVLAAVERVTGRPVPQVRRPAAPEPAVLVADSNRIRDELGWRSPRSSIEAIVADAWEWTRQAPGRVGAPEDCCRQ